MQATPSMSLKPVEVGGGFGLNEPPLVKEAGGSGVAEFAEAEEARAEGRGRLASNPVVAGFGRGPDGEGLAREELPARKAAS
jgi:hypothetical protein